MYPDGGGAGDVIGAPAGFGLGLTPQLRTSMPEAVPPISTAGALDLPGPTVSAYSSTGEDYYRATQAASSSANSNPLVPNTDPVSSSSSSLRPPTTIIVGDGGSGGDSSGIPLNAQVGGGGTADDNFVIPFQSHVDRTYPAYASDSNPSSMADPIPTLPGSEPSDPGPNPLVMPGPGAALLHQQHFGVGLFKDDD